jgi:hypothetical protein
MLEDAGLAVVRDPRNVRPPCVLVEPPTIEQNQNRTLCEVSFPVTVLAPPPGNADSMAWLLRTVDDVIDAVGPTTGGPAVVSIGNAELPAYQLTTTVQLRRTQ